jgi:ABC-type Fe3+ transport system substrate-binding protein
MDDGQKLYNRIEDEYGVSVSYQFKDMGKLTTQLVQEFQANQQTVDYSGATSAGQQNVLKMNEQGILRPVPEHMFDEFQLTPALGGNVGILGYAVGLTVLYNQNQVSNPPTTLDELFSEQWKGNLTVDIRDSEFVPAAREVIGDGWEEFIKNLGEYGVPFESHLGAGEAVARGEYDLSVTYLRYTQYDFGKGILKEASIENFPRTGGQTYGFLTSGAPHPDAGELALRFAAEEARQIKHLHETVGENFYYSVEAWEEEQPNLWAFTFEDAQNMDIEEIDQTWEELCLSRLQG